MAEKHYSEQIRHTENYLIPYFNRHIPDFKNRSILEVGCAEGGFLDILFQTGHDVLGVEISPERVKIAQEKNPKLPVMVGDITDPGIVESIGRTFDVIILRDVIEHIPDRQAAFSALNKILNPGGFLYITFPPRFSGFAGHQQNGRSVLRFMPYLHMLPAALIQTLAKKAGERPEFTETIIRNYKDGLSIRKFEKYYQSHPLKPVVREIFLIRPVFKIRYGLTPRRLPNIPLLREVLALGCEYLLRKETASMSAG